ncbi:hypothetical protein WA026_012027 [Henosepilachna vigintioctopunctata]|uniref:non-specific serine/threonine protein kinase n=1 Tax=Henosepilachna vigintioctopunctata TaxID=420089 RepID=A0AAW1VEY9_9CUCU
MPPSLLAEFANPTAKANFLVSVERAEKTSEDVTGFLRRQRRRPTVHTYDVPSGKYATVCKAVHRTTGVQYAAKFVKKRRRNLDQMKEIIHEIAVLEECASSDRVIRLHEVYESTNEMVLVLELAAGGELQHILDGGQCFEETEARKAMRQILEGVAYLHSRNIAHLDLKPQNILLAAEDCCDDIKLCDFGISKVLEPGVKVREILGTLDYVAPEVLSYEPISLATDIWSIGVLSYVLLSGFSPFGADNKQQTLLNISQCALTFEPEHFSDVSSAAIDFIKSALILDPRKRPSIQEMLDHPWISLKSNISPLLVKAASDTIQVTPRSTPISQRKSLTHLNASSGGTPITQRKTYLQTTDGLSGAFEGSPRSAYQVPGDVTTDEDQGENINRITFQNNCEILKH